jgi:phage N-6-adenine-methyltransferase
MGENRKKRRDPLDPCHDMATRITDFDELNAEFGFTLDVCATTENAKCTRYFDLAKDGLAQDWSGDICWMNPPYSSGLLKKWVEKAFQESLRGALVVALVPANTDTKWWHEFVEPVRLGHFDGEVRFLKGRKRFGNKKQPAPFGSAVVIFGSMSLWSAMKARRLRGIPIQEEVVEAVRAPGPGVDAPRQDRATGA